MRDLTALMTCCALALAGCDGDETTDAGPPGTDSGPGGVDAGPGGVDAGPGGIDAGPFDTGTCMAAPATIEPTCPAFSACGGALEDSWCYSSICIEQADLFGGFMGCMASDVDWSGVTGTVQGRVLFDGTTVRRVATIQLMGPVVIPASCVLFPGICGGTVTMAINSALMPDGSASCTDRMGGGCDCDIMITTGIDSDAAYTVAGDQFMTEGRTFDYCVEMDGSLRVEEVGVDAEEIALQSFTPE